MTATEWTATHQLHLSKADGTVDIVEVMLDEQAAYTEEEWAASAPADWEVVNGKFLFQGQAVPPGYKQVEIR